MTKHTVLYLRQSLDRDNDEFAVDRQRQQCEKLCAERGWLIAAEYKDDDVSASNRRKPRPAYERMLADVRAGRIGRIVVQVADRLYRQPRDLEDLIDLCNEHRVKLVTVTGDLDLSTDPGRMVARILGAVARGEVERKGARQKLALSQRAERGAAWWASRPFGYTTADDPNADRKWAPKGQRIVLHPAEAALLEQAYADVLAGDSLYAIAARWNEAGVSTPRGNRWRGAQLRQLLLSERNAGLRTYQGEIVGEGDWPTIVARDVFDGVAAILGDPKRIPGRTRARVHLLSGLARCWKCGTPLKSARTGGRDIYGCREPGCMAVARVGKPLERFITGLVVERLSQPDAVQLLDTGTGPDAVELRHRAASLRAQIDESRALYEEGVLTASELRTTRANLNAKLGEVEARLHDANRVRVFDGVIGADDVAESFDALPLDRKRAVIATMLDIVVLPAGATGPRFRPETVETTWKV